jgi:hypothetical protein
MAKIKYTYLHPLSGVEGSGKDGVTLEVAGTFIGTEGDNTFIRRIDGLVIDIPTANIISANTVPEGNLGD